MPAEVKLNAYQDRVYRGRLRQIFPSADRAKAIVEVRVSIRDADEHVKPEMTASVTFQEPGEGAGRAGGAGKAEEARGVEASGPPIVLVARRAIADRNGQVVVWVVSAGRATPRAVALGPDRLDQVEVKSGLVPGEAVIVNPPAALNDGAVVRVKGS